MAKKESSPSSGGIERRKSKRLPVLSTFSLFVVIPKKGAHRLTVHDVSELGIGFDADTEGEMASDFPIREGETIALQFYLNQSLYLPLSVRIMRLADNGPVRRIGAEIDKNDPSYKGYHAFIQMLDTIAEVGRVE